VAAACSDGRPTPVAPGPVATSIQILHTTQLRVGDSLDLWSVVHDQAGGEMADALVTWTSDHPEVVRIEGKAKARAVGVGCATATAASGSARATSLICSSSAEMRRIYVFPQFDRLTLAVGTGLSVRMHAWPLHSPNVPLVEEPARWSTEEPALPTVDPDGTLHGVAAGTTTLAARIDGYRVVVKVVVTRGYDLAVLESPAGQYSRPVRFNATGMVVGTRRLCAYESCTTVLPAVWRNGALIQTNLPASAEPADVNDAGQVVGTFLAGGVRHAFLWKDGTFTDLTPGDTVNAAATAINSAGQVVGYRATGKFTSTIVRWSAGTETVLGTFGYASAQAWDVSEDGTIAATLCANDCWGALIRPGSVQLPTSLKMIGQSRLLVSRQGVAAALVDYYSFDPGVWVWQGGAVSLLKGSHHDSIYVEDVGSQGSVVGLWQINPHDNAPFLWSGGDPLLLDGLTTHPEWKPVEAKAIDDAGLIAAVVRLADGTGAAVMLTPQ
jgi:probable HAF family extracellular repeat protein